MEERKWLDNDEDEIVTYEGKKICIRFSGICPHFGGPLAFNEALNEFHCPWHDWRFSISGDCINRRVSSKVMIFEKENV